jgi:hypothetical protein
MTVRTVLLADMPHMLRDVLLDLLETGPTFTSSLALPAALRPRHWPRERIPPSWRAAIQRISQRS